MNEFERKLYLKYRNIENITQLLSLKLYSLSLFIQVNVLLFLKKKLKKKTLWPLFMDGVRLPQGYSHFEEAVYFLPFSSQKFLVLILSTSQG